MLLNEYTGIEGIRNRPGIDNEKKYYKWLLNCINQDPNYAIYGISGFKWDSLREKSSYDFAVNSYNFDGRIFIDVVGFQFSSSGSIRLNTAHKDFVSQLKELSDPGQCDFHDCFKLYQAFFFEGEWLYLPIHAKLPRGNITLDKKRFKQVRRAKTVFGDNAKKVFLKDLNDIYITIDNI